MRTNELPDVTSDGKAKIALPLQWVGMEQIAVPISIRLQNDALQTTVAKANVFVSLDDANAKGIHMSRLHGAINKLAKIECNQSSIELLLNEIIDSQLGISSKSKIELQFEIMIQKPALLSDEFGYQAYATTISAEKNQQGFICQFDISIPYSSTCPCSASLARQLVAEAIDQNFPQQEIDKQSLLEWIQSKAGSIATPHSQRSFANIFFSIGKNQWPNLSELVFDLEKVIATPVQTAVKRIDEQEFARLNATNLMFCEDAARKIKHFLDNMPEVKTYSFKVDHRESLHAHNAVVRDEKN